MQRVAQLAGVSTSTVSRVVNNHPSVASETANSVRQAMRKLSFSPVLRRKRIARSAAPSLAGTSVAFLVFGTAGPKPAPAFEKLLRGVSSAANETELTLGFQFISDPSELPGQLLARGVNGLLIHGERPSPAVQARLAGIPTVWLMANRQRALWGDQVMPDNPAIGELAAKYLTGRGHKRVAYLGIGGGSWSFGLRAFSFERAVRDAGAESCVLEARTDQSDDFWRTDGLPAAASNLAERLASMAQPPTGLFVAEDRLLPVIHTALQARGIFAGPSADVEMVSCNNEQPHLMGLQAPPATIDIRPETIGRLGVEQLLWRMRNREVGERVRVMVEPVLIEACQVG